MLNDSGKTRGIEGRATPNKNRVIAIAGLLLLMLLAVSVLIFMQFANNSYDKYETVALIDGEPVFAGELAIYIDGAKAETLNYFRQTHNTGFGEKFWTTSVNGEIPLEYAISAAMGNLVLAKAEQFLYREAGIVSDISYKAFYDSWVDENKRRAGGAEIIFGPQQYTEAIYYNYLQTNRANEMKNILRENNTFAAGENVLFAEYAAQYDTLIKSYGKMTAQVVSVSLTGNGAPGRDDAEKIISGVKNEIDNGATFEEAAAKYNCTLSEEIYDDDTMRLQDYKYDDEKKNMIMGLDVGKTSDVISLTGAFEIIKCVNKTGVQYYSFEEAKPVLQEAYMNREYKGMVDSIANNAKVDILDCAYDQMEAYLMGV